MRHLLWLATGAIAMLLLLAGGGILYIRTLAHGFSANVQPTALETFAASEAREIALPDEVRNKQNPVPASEEVLSEARAHWADHCAACHANDGSGVIPMGQHMYPPAPDMRKDATQKKSDGELFYIIQNGIRLTGMPAWGTGAKHDEQDSWKLVRLIRHLPKLTAEEQREMESLNPKTPDELREEEEEKQFLNGDEPHEQTKHEHHH